MITRTTPSVSVITRTKNRILLLERAIKSVLSQEYDSWHHIIVNDGGDPAFVEALVSRYCPQYDGRLTVIHNEMSLAMESASNAGLSIADSEYFCIHDDDDSWEPHFLIEMTNCLDSHGMDPAIGGVVCYANVIMEDVEGDRIVEQSRHVFSQYDGMSYFSMLGRNWFPPICFLIRTAVLNKIGGFDGALPVLGDWEFNKRFMRHFELVVYRKVLANYHHRNKATGAFSNSVYAENDQHRAYRLLLLDREIKQALDSGQLNEGLLNVVSSLNQKICDLEIQMKSLKSDMVWELKNHINWALNKKG